MVLGGSSLPARVRASLAAAGCWVAAASHVYGLNAAMLLPFLGDVCFFMSTCLRFLAAVQQKRKHDNVLYALLTCLRCLALRCVYADGSCALLTWPANGCSTRYFKYVALPQFFQLRSHLLVL